MNITYIKKPDILKWYIYKILLIMRLTTVILMVSMLRVNASTVAQEFSYVKKGVSVMQIFNEIKKQTGYNIIWNEKRIDVTTTIYANFKKATIHDVLTGCLSSPSLSYSINDKMLELKEKESLFRKELTHFFSFIDVRGRVVDENNAPLVGAVVKVKGTSISSPTNSNGQFVLRNVDENAVLIISFVGYVTQEVKASGNMGSVKLMLSTDNLKEVEINAGYYIVTDRERTGSISRITSKDIEKQPVNNPLMALQGRINGLQITQTTGAPGGGFTVRVRGQNSISQGNDPFYIVNGVPYNALALSASSIGITTNPSPLASINPNDIESIEVLKDADATAIYGSRGANGVILITTKVGKRGQNIATISINQGVSKVGHMMDLMNTEQYLTMRREAKANDNLPIATTDYDINGTWDPDKYTDWQKELIGKAAPSTNVQATLSGGTNSITYSIGGNYYREQTVFLGASSYKRASGNLSLQYISENKKLTVALDANYSQVNSNLFISDITQYILLPPNHPNLLDDKGLLNWQNNSVYINPLAIVKQPYDAKTNNLIANTSLSYILMPNFKIRANFGSNIGTRNEFNSTPLTTYPSIFNLGPTDRISNFSSNSSDNSTIEGQAEYSKKIRSGKLSVLIGTTFQQGIRDLQKVAASGYNSDAFMTNISSASTFQTGATYTQYRYTAVFGRLNYSFLDKYFINATGRRDGSSRFGKAKQFADFGALGAAWIITEEKFMKENLPFISFTKLRGSYGITGNDQITDYGYLELWSNAGSYQGTATTSPANISNPNYAWEVNKKAEIALDVNFLRDRIAVAAGYYTNRSSSQLVFTSLAPSSGFSDLIDNLPATINNRGWEFELHSKNFSSTFSWSTSLNLTIPKNELIAYPGLKESNYAQFYAIGEPLSIKKLYNTYIDNQTGIYTRVDIDENGIINAIDQNLIEFVGQKYYGSIQNSFTYKGFNLDFMFQLVKQTGSDFYFGFRTPGQFSPFVPYGNQLAALNDRWTGIGSIAEYQKYSTQSAAITGNRYANVFGNRSVFDASYIRLKNISFSYNLSSQLIKRLKMSNAKFYMQGQNLFTFTNFKGLDPETQSLTVLPPLRVLSAGIQFTL